MRVTLLFDEGPREFERPKSGLDRRILLLACGTFAIGTDAFVIAGILPAIARDLSVRIELAGQLISAYTLTYAVGAPILAAVVARWQRERVILAALWCFAAANILCALSPTFGVLMVTRVFAGLCAAVYTPTAYVVATELAEPARRGTALATVTLGITCAFAFGVPLGTWIAEQTNWQSTFASVAAVTAVGALILRSAGLSGIESSTPIASLKARIAPIARPAVLITLMPSLLSSTASWTVYAYIALVIVDVPGWGIPQLLVARGVGCLVGSQLGGRLVDRFGSTLPILASLTIAMIALATLDVASTNSWGTLTALFCWSMCQWTILAPQQARLIAVEPENSGVVLSLNNSANYLGGALGAGLGALVLAHLPASALCYVGAGMFAVAIVVFTASLYRARRRVKEDR
jgi:DHA1 family inner membrane transport protein